MHRQAVMISAMFISNFSFANAEEGAHGLNWWGLGSAYVNQPAIGWSLLTFFVFVGALFYALRQPTVRYLQVRSEQIRQSIEEARRAKESADRRVREYEEKLKKLDDQAASMHQEFAEQGKKEKALLEKAAKQVAEQIAKDTQEAIDAEIARAFAMLQAEAAAHAVKLAKLEIRSRMTPQIEEQLNHDFARTIATMQ